MVSIAVEGPAMPQNKTLSPPSGATRTGNGSGVIIGDGIMLTAGHVMYEFNERTNVAARDVRVLSGSTIFWDPRDYLLAYEAIYKSFVTLPTVSDPNRLTISSEHIEINLRTKDIVFVNFGGDVGKNDAGLVTYLNLSDITTKNFGLVSQTKYKRWGQTTREKEVNDGFLSISSTGLRITDLDAITEPGDSGGANWIEFEGREFILGNNVSSTENPKTHSHSSYIRPNEFYQINEKLESAQSGNASDLEPTNLVVGSANSDTAKGTYRADIILGREHNSGDTILNWT
jgi:hypothetical protein